MNKIDIINESNLDFPQLVCDIHLASRYYFFFASSCVKTRTLNSENILNHE